MTLGKLAAHADIKQAAYCYRRGVAFTLPWPPLAPRIGQAQRPGGARRPGSLFHIRFAEVQA